MNKIIPLSASCLSNPLKGTGFNTDLTCFTKNLHHYHLLEGGSQPSSLPTTTHTQPRACQGIRNHYHPAAPHHLSYSSVFGFQDLGTADSPSSMRVNRGSTNMMNMDEDTDAESEPQLLRHGSLPCEDEPEPEEVVEEPVIATNIHLLGQGKIQKITKSEDENEIVVVDDYLEDKTASAAQPEGVETGEEIDLSTENQVEVDTSQQKESDLAEAAQETKAEQDSEKQEVPKDNEEGKEDIKSKEEDDQSTEGGEKTEEQNATKPANEGKNTDSDDDFIEIRPEAEKIHDAERITSQVNPQPKEGGASGGETRTTLEEPEQKIDVQQYFLRKKPSAPPVLPPKEKHYF